MNEKLKQFEFIKDHLTCKRCGSTDVRTDKRGIVTCRRCIFKWRLNDKK